MLRSISQSRIFFDSGSTSELDLFSCRATVEPNCNLVWRARSRTTEMGLGVVNEVYIFYLSGSTFYEVLPSWHPICFDANKVFVILTK